VSVLQAVVEDVVVVVDSTSPCKIMKTPRMGIRCDRVAVRVGGAPAPEMIRALQRAFQQGNPRHAPVAEWLVGQSFVRRPFSTSKLELI
jgi:hypothetical protein